MSAITGKLRRLFITGLLVSLPLAVTVVVFKFIFDSLDNFLGPIVTAGLLALKAPIPEDFHLPGLGVIVTILLVMMIGLFTRNYVGKKLWGIGEMIVDQIPGIRSVYYGAKQIIDTFATSNTKAFSKVVMLEYPRKGIWCLAFITGKTEGEARVRTNLDLVNIFLPTTPNPTSGFLLLVPKEDLIELDMTIEEGVKMIVSGGIVTPDYLPEGDKKRIDEGKESKLKQFFPQMIEEKVSDEVLGKLAKGHKGTIKVVVDIKTNTIAAGAEWHVELRDILVKNGSYHNDCWGAKLDTGSGAIKFTSQINEGRQGSTGLEVTAKATQKAIEEITRKVLR